MKFSAAEVAGMYVYSLLKGVTFELIPLSSYALSTTMLLATVRNIFSNTCCGTAFTSLDVFNILKFSSLLSLTLFLETARSHSETNQGNMVGVPFQ
jgi:hypothetical protein